MNNTVDVFPISATAFGLRSDWFEMYAPQFIRPSYLLMVLLLVISIGLMVARRFEHADFEKKAWNIPVLILVVTFWPAIIMGLKSLVDSFNTFLVYRIFGMPWKGFGFPDIGDVGILGWSGEGLARLAPNLAYWLIYAFYIIFFFFYAILGPLLLAKGILADEMETILELVQEVMTLLLWQTTVVVLVAFMMPDIVSGQPFPPKPEANFYILSFILGIMLFFVPSLTRKLTRHVTESFAPMGLKWGGFLVGASLMRRAAGPVVTAVGADLSALAPVRSAVYMFAHAEELKKRYEHKSEILEREDEKDHYRDEIRHQREEISELMSEIQKGKTEEKTPKKDLLSMAKKAKTDFKSPSKGSEI